MIKEAIRVKGHVKLTARDPKTGEIVAAVERDNLVVTSGLELIAKMLVDTSGFDTGLTYCAVGTGTTAVDTAQTTLITETSRKAITLKDRATSTIYLFTSFLSTEANVYIKEIGIFGHSTASGTANSGVMFSRALLSYDNSGGSPRDISIEWTVTFS